MTIQEAIEDMTNKVTFNEKRHIYTRNSDGKYLSGVSTIAGLLPKDWAMAYGAKEAVKELGYYDVVEDQDHKEDNNELIRRLSIIKKLTYKGYYQVLKNAKGAFARKNKEATDIGTEGHKLLEEFVKDEMNGIHIHDEPPKELERPIKEFWEWEKNNIRLWAASEARVYSEEHEFAGTLDAIALTNENKFAIIDFKFANRISEDFYLQTAGYAIPFEQYGIKFDQRIIVRLPKTEYLVEYDEKKHVYKKVSNEFEVQVCPNSYEFDKKTFLALREVQKWISFNKNKGD